MSPGTFTAVRRAALVVVFSVAAAPGAGWAQRRASPDLSPCNVRTAERVVAVGDIHGAHESFVAILRAAGLIDGGQRWSGGKAVLVQTGDVLDRGPDSRKSLDLLRRLEREARRAGGRVYALLGNHEWMRVTSDWRFVSAGELQAFTTPASAGLRERALTAFTAEAGQRARDAGQPFDAAAHRARLIEALPVGGLEMRAAFDADGEYGAWVRTRPAVARINGVLFLHGGISAEAAALGCAKVNAAIRDELAALPLDPDRVATLFASSETGPLWYRGLAQEPESTFAPALEDILRRMEVRTIVIGHTVTTGRITRRFGGRVIQIDTGMLDGEFYPGGAASALEITGATATAIYLDRREALPPIP